MSFPIFYQGKILFKDDKPAFDPACCCNAVCPPSDCVTLFAEVRFDADDADLAALASDDSWFASFVPPWHMSFWGVFFDPSATNTRQVVVHFQACTFPEGGANQAEDLVNAWTSFVAANLDVFEIDSDFEVRGAHGRNAERVLSTRVLRRRGRFCRRSVRLVPGWSVRGPRPDSLRG